ncbi:MAG TPA: hypothetical protein VML56_09895 [Burkholderiales bacterium]|nr:hypothetical protein [Burkholderiales bacterium]
MKIQRILVGFVSLLLVSCVFSFAMAADTEQAYVVFYAKFKPGKAPEALKIIHEHFWPVDKKVGRKAIPFDFVTGEWDHIVYFPYDTGRLDTIPSNAEWWKAFVEQEGGPDQAQRLFQSFLDLHANSKAEIAKSPGPLMGGSSR